MAIDFAQSDGLSQVNQVAGARNQGLTAPELNTACWINLKTLLDKAFRLFFPEKVPTIGVIGGKI